MSPAFSVANTKHTMKAVTLIISLLLQVSFGFLHCPIFHCGRLPSKPTHASKQQHCVAIQEQVIPALETLSFDTTKTTFRRMEQEDVPEIVRLYVREYGSMNPQRPFTLFPPIFHGLPMTQYCDNFVLACIFYMALYQRLNLTWIAETDHQVWTLCSQQQNEVVGVAELSFQASGHVALPIGLPLEVKKKLYGVTHLVPYISSVIVKESLRGCGYGTILLNELEQRAGRYSELTLHVDANATVAKALYEKLGYCVMETRRNNEWFGRIFRLMAGLYFIPQTGEQLYMRKELP